MQLSEFAIGSIDSILQALLDERIYLVKAIGIVCESTPDEPRYSLFGTTEEGNDVRICVNLPAGLLRTDTTYGAITAVAAALEEALRGLEATGRLMDSVYPREVTVDFGQMQSVLREHVDKEIQAQFASESTLYKEFAKRSRRRPYQGLQELLDTSDRYWEGR